jgi:dTDP-4-amino-4,6-dideoxygalactose transaminase
MSDTTATIARVQLASLDAFISIRREISSRYDDSLSDSSIVLSSVSDGDIPFRYVVRSSEKNADTVIALFETRGISE